jgi:hypothetical protein
MFTTYRLWVYLVFDKFLAEAPLDGNSGGC